MAQKYRQRGYKDDEREERPVRQQGPRERKEGPRGRGLGAPTATVFRCARCGRQIEVAGPVALDAACPQCSTDLHTCSNCRHFDPSVPLECRQEIEVRIAKKSTRNNCEHFAPKQIQVSETDRGKGDDARSAFDALFKI